VRETVGWLGTWLRLLWRHWPVLLSLAAAAVMARSLLITYVLVDAARWREGLGGELAFALLPIVMLTSMILMLRVVRPSLPYLGPRERPEPVLRHLGAVAVAFVAFYFTAGYLVRDFQFFGERLANVASMEAGANSLNEFLGVATESRPLPTILSPDRPEIFLAIAGGAFVVRWILSLLGSGRRSVLGLVAVYPEVLWVAASATAYAQYSGKGKDWIARTRIYEWFTSTVASWDLPGLTTVFPSVEGVGAVVVIPVAALVTGTAVLVASARARPAPATGLRRLVPVAEGPSGGQFGAIWDAVKRVFRAGVPATMIFCVAFAAVSAAPGYLYEFERILIGHQDYLKVWLYLEFPLVFLNESLTLVLMFALIAAFVDRTAAREARLAGEETAPAPATAPDAGATVLDSGAPLPGPRQPVPAGPASAPSRYGPAPQGAYGHGQPGPYGQQGSYGQPATGSSM
jgi:hypothetical protein